MLAAIRKYSNSPVAKTFLFVLAITFISSFGLFQVIRKFLGKDYVIKIGSRRISPGMFRHEKINVTNFGKGFSKNADGAFDKNSILQKIIYENVIDLAVADFGFFLSETILKQYISSLFMFRDKNGVFNAGLFRAFLRKIQIPENAFMNFFKN
ncbi:MAG: SurA N-terminal domain-containing protein, partial [Holosporaceae bacterium]|nr:SurA N-terminal domain-containing protein [Holosporaceae bacterium]